MGKCDECLQDAPIGVISNDFMKFSKGKYSGREIAVHRPAWDEDGVVIRYKLSGRSDGSKSREMLISKDVRDLDDKCYTKSMTVYPSSEKEMPNVYVKTSPLAESDDYTRAYQIYTAIQTLDDSEFILISNGHQTDSLIERARKCADFHYHKDEYLKAVLNAWGPETDGPNKSVQTSRIAGIVTMEKNGFDYSLGAIDRYHNTIMRSGPVKSIEPGHTAIVSTYRHDTPWMDIPAEVRVVGESLGEQSFSEEVEESWKDAKQETVTLRKTGEEIPVIASMAWLYVQDDGKMQLQVRDAFKD